MKGHSSVRGDCLRLLEGLVGRAGVQPFLREFQPELGATGGEMLRDWPERLAAHLRRKAADLADPTSDPILDHLPAMRRKGSASRVLRILDELDRSNRHQGGLE